MRLGLFLLTLSCAGCSRYVINTPDATPGTLVRLTPAKGAIGAQAVIQVGGETATALREPNGKFATVMIPQLPPGRAAITIDKRRAGFIEVLDAPYRQLLLEREGNGYKLVSLQPVSSAFERSTTAESARISYDVLSASGALLWSGAFAAPGAGRQEVFEGPNSTRPLHGVARRSLLTAVRIPSGGALVKLYRAAAGLDLNTLEGRASRQMISEISLTGRRP